jgi:hypothetical protein
VIDREEIYGCCQPTGVINGESLLTNVQLPDQHDGDIFLLVVVLNTAAYIAPSEFNRLNFVCVVGPVIEFLYPKRVLHILEPHQVSNCELKSENLVQISE